MTTELVKSTDAVAGEINKKHARLRAMGEAAYVEAVGIGAALDAQCELLGQSRFPAWCSTLDFPMRAVRKYRRIYKAADTDQLTLPGMLADLRQVVSNAVGHIREQQPDPVDVAEPLQDADVGSVDFDWDTVLSRLDGDDGATPTKERSGDAQLFLKWLDTVMFWLLFGNGPHTVEAIRLSAVSRRACAMAWVAMPHMMEGKSGRELAEALGVAPEALSRDAASFSRATGMVSRAQSHYSKGRRRGGAGAP